MSLMGSKQAGNIQPFWKICILCTVSAIGNILLSFFINGLTKFPLYLDTVFTAAICFTAGLVPGIITGIGFPAVLTPFKYVYMLKLPVETCWVVYFFFICALAEILLICFFHKKIKPREVEFLNNLAAGKSLPQSFIPLAVQLLTLTVLACIVISVIGGIISYIVGLLSIPRSRYPEDTFLLGLLRNNVPQLASAILSRIPINIVDRFIVIFGGYGISLLYRKWLGGWVTES